MTLREGRHRETPAETNASRETETLERAEQDLEPVREAAKIQISRSVGEYHTTPIAEAARLAPKLLPPTQPDHGTRLDDPSSLVPTHTTFL
jgi:hypothetical protein